MNYSDLNIEWRQIESSVRARSSATSNYIFH
jgi:hypothetical protein